MHLFHFFIPHKKNNHRAKLLHNASLVTLILLVAFTCSLSVVLKRTHPDVLGVSYQITENELVNLTNFERAQQGLEPLILNKRLSEAAALKADYMYVHNFWAHFAPDGTTPWKFIKDTGYEYTYAGENLAKGYTTSTTAVTAWMNSPTHKANILSDKYTEIGFAVKSGILQGEDTVLIVQMFGAREGNIAELEGGQLTQTGASHTLGVESPVAAQALVEKPLINLTFFTKSLTFILLSLLLIALVLDFVVIEKKKIPRSVGNNLDHVMLVTVFIAFLLMAKIGNIM